MESNKGVLAAFLGTLAIITYREYKSSDAAGWKIPYIPPPYVYTWGAVVFGLLALLADIVSPRIATVIAVGVMIGVLLPVLKNAPATGGATSGSAANPPSTGATPAGGGTVSV